ncbi:Eco57I restriction-modification methylase domain-containing protein [Prevotella melaninogenica]|uniref:Eco57I restriction-modification methylase domain-containing protein n=1 Tax=Prevotella melaninogenica TaxID=28132 RepID=UPI001BACF96D|nr:Eco57I restriction-modification methylase domain-containing protein [Prevotella melaninogenica]QUB56950.1 Eco57I restriction-modification methylase domain-containing protein [Prevotella melaninogenica]QUB59309.1 Eco57I restriction-modification methylase domain-containing protein [Prevotella melaninogenica]
MEDSTLIQEIIIGRVEPHIYAFSTGTIPNYLKVGDTYRPVMMRLEEWRRHFPDLEKRYVEKAKVDETTYFRDYAVHQYLETERGRVRLIREELAPPLYFSREFFRGATEEDVEQAISDIRQAYKDKLQRYTYFSFEDGRIPINYVYKRKENYEPRPNQLETIERFKSALEKGRSNLLMYAVMRFGKSFTSMCCALEMDAKLVVVVSAKADVKTEWKRTVESHVSFVDYVFLDSDSLLQDERILETTLHGKKAVVFLTLQDLLGQEIKDKHRMLFEQEIDLLLIDESHYGARAEEYGRVLKISKKELQTELQGLDTADAYDQNSELKVLKSRVRIHLSGTPYRILMGSEFTEDDIIAFYQFSDIVEAQAQWDQEHLFSDDVKEWDNPYYGFPQMVRFAFLPNKSSRERLENLRRDGISSNLSELMRPKSISADKKDHLHCQFVHETEILGLLQAIDGSEADEQILSLLGLEEIQQGKMCRHMVFVLPYRASCDAMESLLKTYKDAFNHLGGYAIINIAGLESERLYPTTESVKSQIEKYEQDNTKTITLTVNRMLTGSTVKEWDTMLYLKDSVSPQEYDQAVFRLQNQYIRTLVSDNGESIKYNMKPQTLLVDFDPNRMFRLQEQRSQIYNANTEQRGNEELRRRIERELEYSPIVTIGSNGLQRVSPTDVMDAVRAYSANRSVMDEATDIPLDYTLLADETLRNAISLLNPIDASKGIEIKAVTGEEVELDFEEEPAQNQDNTDNTEDTDRRPTPQVDEEKNTDNLIGKKLATYYAQILFYAFLTESSVDSLQTIITSIESSEENKRIARHVGLNVSILKLVQQKSNVFPLRGLDYKIENLNGLMRDETLTPMKRVEVAMAKFGRLSSSEIVTPQSVALEMLNALGNNAITSETKILDIASKQGEFTRALISKYGTNIGRNVYALPTSSVSYEFTRKVYSLLGLDTDQVISDFTTYDLLNPEHKESLIQQLKDMNFDLVIGNPPYQQADGGAAASAKPIYQEFVTIAKEVSTTYTSIIMPARWYTGGKGLDEFRASMLTDKHIKLLYDYQRPDEVFPDTNNRGGLCFIVRDNNFDNTLTLPEVVSNRGNQEIVSQVRSIKTDDLEMFIRHQEAISVLKKVTENISFASLSDAISARRPFGIDGNITKDIAVFKKQKNPRFSIICYGRSSSLGYITLSTVKNNSEWINRWKVFMPYANNIGTELNDDNLNAFVGQPNSVATETFLVVGADLSLDENSAQALVLYLRTRFVRFMHSLAKASQHATSKTYRFVPLQDFTEQSDIDWGKSAGEIDKQLYAKYGLSEEEIAFIEGTIKAMK